jgi:putative hemolysin
LDPEPYLYSNFLNVLAPESQTYVIIAFIVISILLFCSAMISGSEVGFFSLSPKDKNKLKYSKHKTSRLAEKLLRKPELLLATILVSNNFINVAIIIISTYLSAFLFANIESQVLYILLQMIGVTLLILIFGEMIPKVYAGKYPSRVARTMAIPLSLASKIFYPISFFLIKSTDLVNKRLQNKNNQNISIEELSHVIELASDDLKEEKTMLEGILNSANLEVKEIMTSRVEVFAIDYNSKFTKVLGQIVESAYSRIPVFIDNLDNIKGVLYIKDVLPYIYLQNKEDFKWQKLIRPHFIVPETKKINDLLSDFQIKKLHIAIVVDEYGGVSGLVTLEDILEEFVGEIHDESDSEENLYTILAENIFEFDAKISIIDFCKIVETEYAKFQEIKGESDSLAGLLLEVNGDMPKKNSTIKLSGFEFTVTAADERRIKKIKVKIPNEE